MPQSLRFFLYTQHLSGTGHFVRIFEIACGLAKNHEVYLLDGGRLIPRPPPRIPFKKLILPRIYRSPEGLASVDSTQRIDEIMKIRKSLLMEFVERVKPHVLLFEHFPFSKGILAQEIIPVIEKAREQSDKVKIVCSVRDILPITRRDPHPQEHRVNVLKILHRYFDRILVHADPNIIRLDEHIPWIDEITLPIIYTGYVSEKPDHKKLYFNTHSDDTKEKGKVAIVSGGGGGCLSMISQCIKAWSHPELNRISRTLLIFTPLFLPKDDRDQLNHYVKRTDVKVKPFASNFIDWMQAADLSISQAGYNTCANILETRTPAILIPDTEMSDQLPRAKLLSAHGVATMIDPSELNPHTLGLAIRETLAHPKIHHNFDLDGAQKTCQILESF